MRTILFSIDAQRHGNNKEMNKQLQQKVFQIKLFLLQGNLVVSQGFKMSYIDEIPSQSRLPGYINVKC